MTVSQKDLGECRGYRIRQAGTGFAAGRDLPDGRWRRESIVMSEVEAVRAWCLIADHPERLKAEARIRADVANR